MHPLEKKIDRLSREQALFGQEKNLVVGVSGGADSTALLQTLAACSTPHNLMLTAVYVNHGLRPEETGAEENLVRLQAQALGVDFITGEIPVRQYAEEQKISIEHSARELRYGFLKKVAAERGAVKVVVAHTADDQAEELLLRLIRGTGRRGLAGMEYCNDTEIVRPFLEVEKSEILRYLADKKIPFAEDSSNREKKYLRNRVRLELLPYLEENFNPGIKDTLRRVAEILRAEEELLEELAEKAFARAVRSLPVGQEEDADGLKLELDVFLEESLGLRRRVVEKIFLRLDNTPSFEKIERIIALSSGQEGQAIVHFNQGLRALKEAGRIQFFYPQGRTSRRGNLLDNVTDYFEILVEGPGIYEFAGQTIEVSLIDEPPEPEELKADTADYFDAAALVFPLVVRSAKAGDRFDPLGGPGTKKVNDFFSDQKIPRPERPWVPVVISAGRVAGLLGLRPDKRFAVSGQAGKVLKLVVS